MVDKALFSSASTEYETPDWVFKPVAERLGLNFDAAASHENHKLPNYATPEGIYIKNFSTPHRESSDDGLTTSWGRRRIWCNPPYGRGIEAWVRKAALAIQTFPRAVGFGELVCSVAALLLPARTETDWFQRWVFPYAEVHFLMGRIKFEGTSSSAPFPSVIAVYDSSLPPIPQGEVRAYVCDLRSGEFRPPRKEVNHKYPDLGRKPNPFTITSS